MGLAVLPARLKAELNEVKECLINKVPDISNKESISKHADWYKQIIEKYDIINEENANSIIRDEVGNVFLEVLNHAGVFKRTSTGLDAFDKFIEIL